MKGLLLKDWYMIVKYGRFFLLFYIMYAMFSVYSEDSVFFILMNVILNSMIVKTLMAYEEQSRWDSFAVNDAAGAVFSLILRAAYYKRWKGKCHVGKWFKSGKIIRLLAGRDRKAGF
ncbi:MAG: ABC-2 transporter permease [Lachnospiraceae bacterium]|nr:ABC-2 transporter permease [Lachnospiraceae bacterium]